MTDGWPGVSLTDELRAEVSALHGHRGLRRPTIATRVGPLLRRVLDVRPGTTDAELAVRLVATLRQAANRLPPDLQATFVIASGLDADDRLLRDRLARAAAYLDRDVRTVRRRLREADLAVATWLVARLVERQRPNPNVPAGWEIDRMSSTLRLDRDAPEFHSLRTIVVTAERLTQVVETISIPRPLRDGRAIDVRAIHGGEVRSIEPLSTSSWRITTALDRALRSGDEHEYGLVVGVPSQDFIRPYNVMVPFRYCRSFEAEVRFGSARVQPRGWILDGMPPVTIEDDLPGPEGFHIEPDGVVNVRFDGLLNGLAYGLRWLWGTS